MGIQFKLIVTVWVNTGVLSQKQFGSLPNKGTEQARLVQVLALEFAWVMEISLAHGTEDKTHAFDSPHQLGGYELALLRLGVPVVLLDIIKLIDEEGLMLVRIVGALTEAVRRMRGTVQGGEESPPKWVAFDDIVLTAWEMERDIDQDSEYEGSEDGFEVQVSGKAKERVIATAFVDDKHLFDRPDKISGLYEIAAAVGIFHGVEMVPKKSLVQVGVWEGQGASRDLSVQELGKQLRCETNTPYLAPLFPSKGNAPSEAPPSDHRYSNNYA